MKFIVLLTIFGIAGLCYFGGTSGPDGVLSDMVDCLNEMTDVLETVKDKEAAIKALPKLQKLGREMEAAGVKMTDCISKVNPQEMQEIIVKYQNPIDDANQRFTKEVMRVSGISGVGMEYQQLFAFANAGSSRSSST
jgi:hypothetical protein